MSSSPLCALHFPASPHALPFADGVLGALADANLQPVGWASLWLCAPTLGDGAVALSVAAADGELALAEAARWAEVLGQRGMPAWWVAPVERVAKLEAAQPGTLGALAGQGLIPCSAGLSGRPLVSLSPAQLREELEASHRALRELTGQPALALMPAPNSLGRATDGLVVREARRAGYRLILTPSLTPRDRADVAATGVLGVRSVEPSKDRPAELRDWVRGRGMSRTRGAIRELLRGPRRVIEALQQGQG